MISAIQLKWNDMSNSTKDDSTGLVHFLRHHSWINCCRESLFVLSHLHDDQFQNHPHPYIKRSSLAKSFKVLMNFTFLEWASRCTPNQTKELDCWSMQMGVGWIFSLDVFKCLYLNAWCLTYIYRLEIFSSVKVNVHWLKAQKSKFKVQCEMSNIAGCQVREAYSPLRIWDFHYWFWDFEIFWSWFFGNRAKCAPVWRPLPPGANWQSTDNVVNATTTILIPMLFYFFCFFIVFDRVQTIWIMLPQPSSIRCFFSLKKILSLFSFPFFFFFMAEYRQCGWCYNHHPHSDASLSSGNCLYCLNSNKKHRPFFYWILKIQLILAFLLSRQRSGQLALFEHKVGTIFSEWKMMPTGTKSEVLFSFGSTEIFYQCLWEFPFLLSTIVLFKLDIEIWLLWVLV